MYRLSNGRKHRNHASAGDGACLLRPQLLLQRQLSIPNLDRCQLDHRLPAVCQKLHC
ncbi:Uncharacterised protein [Vibrio cholerae]|nr:Uncharacterised protein [Vibrio cholerae]